jgi:hypothetical protein
MYNIPATPPLHMYHVASWCPDGGFTWSTYKFLQNVDLQRAVIRGAYIVDVSTQVACVFWGRDPRSFIGE